MTTTEEPHSSHSPSHDSQPQPASNAINHINLVEAFVRKADKEADEERKLIDLFRQQLHLMKTKVQNFQQEVMNTLRPAIENCTQELAIVQLQQKEDNVGFQNQITELRKEKSIIGQMIASSVKQTQELGEQVGGY